MKNGMSENLPLPDFPGEESTSLKPLFDSSGFRVLIGIISADNKQSIALVEKCGFEKCAHFKEVGEKFGKILDVVAYQKILDR